jgi:hypothetical protein
MSRETTKTPACRFAHAGYQSKAVQGSRWKHGKRIPDNRSDIREIHNQEVSRHGQIVSRIDLIPA